MSNTANIFQAQLKDFEANGAPTYEQRVSNLKKILVAIDAWEDRIIAAIKSDFGSGELGGRSSHETIIAETFVSKTEIKYTLKHLKKWMRPKKVKTALHFKPGRGEIRYQALGVVGVISPWNYPFSLAIVPIVAALAAGNRVMLKPSEHTPNTSDVLAKMLGELFDAKTVATVIGGVEVATEFSELPFHHIFFTGSTMVGKIVAQAAAKNLTPVTLELGGKSPVIIDPSADLSLSAKRITAGKTMNSGQTCVAPDYILMAQKDIQPFAEQIIKTAEDMYPTIADNPDYTSIVSDRQYQRQMDLLDDARKKGATVMQAGNDSDNAMAASRKIPLSIILGVTPDMRVMQEEIFGPLLPILSVESPQEAINHIGKDDRPLALYWFGSDTTNREKVLNGTLSGGVSINDTIMHVAQENLPFGGVGGSGMGSYHGEYGFKTFSHARSIFHQSKFSGTKMFYPPYTEKTDKLLKFLKKHA